MRQFYASIMDPELNPLANLTPVRRFQVMVMLSLMWSIAFCAAAGLWIYTRELVVAHLLLAAATLITGASFRAARQPQTYRDQPRRDGTPRYDDVWGG